MASFTVIVSICCLVQFKNRLTEELAQRMFQHPAYHRYQHNNITKSQALASIAATFHVEEDMVAEILLKACNACEIQQQLLSALSLYCIPTMKVVGWIDIPGPEWEVVSSKFPHLWHLFTHIYPTLEAATQQYDDDQSSRSRLMVIHGDVEHASFLNCSGAVKAIPFVTPQNRSTCLQLFKTLQLGAANIEAGRDALHKALKNVSTSIVLYEATGKEKQMVDYAAPALVASLAIFSTPLYDDIFSSCTQVTTILHEIATLVRATQPFGFNGTDLSGLPPDLDTMSLCTSAVLEHEFITAEEASKMLDLILENVNEEGVLMVNMDAGRPRMDHVVLVNVIFLAYMLQRQSHPVVRRQEALVQQFLLSGGYAWGTKYYHPETFLFQYGSLLHCFPHKVPSYDQLLAAIKKAIVQLCGHSSSLPTAIAKRILLSSMLRMGVNQQDVNMLLQMQKCDGSWPPSPIYLAPTRKASMLNPAIEMSFVLAALHAIHLNSYS